MSDAIPHVLPTLFLKIVSPWPAASHLRQAGRPVSPRGLPVSTSLALRLLVRGSCLASVESAQIHTHARQAHH